MATGEVRELPNEIAAPLLRCGYLIPVKEKSGKGKDRVKAEDPAESENQAGQKDTQK